MRSLLVAMFALAVWSGPASAAAVQVKSPLSVMALSIWAEPLNPGSELDPSDPQVLEQSASALIFMSITTGEAWLPEDFDTFYNDFIGSFATNTSNANAEEVPVSQHGIESRAFSLTSEGVLYDVLVSYDMLFLHALVAISVENSPSLMPTLADIADQVLNPSRPDYMTGTMQAFVDGFVPSVADHHLTLLNRLPHSSEVPAEYQLIEEEVIIF